MRTSFGWVGRGKYGSFLLMIDKAMRGAWLGLGYVAYLSIKCRRFGVRGHLVQTHQSKDPEPQLHTTTTYARFEQTIGKTQVTILTPTVQWPDTASSRCA